MTFRFVFLFSCFCADTLHPLHAENFFSPSEKEQKHATGRITGPCLADAIKVQAGGPAEDTRSGWWIKGSTARARLTHGEGVEKGGREDVGRRGGEA